MAVVSEYSFFQKLAALPFVQAIWLYGSRARNDGTDRSDIDIAIIAPGASRDDWFLVTEIIDRADTLLHIDCVRFDELSEGSFKQKILEQKKELYTRKTSVEKKFWSHSFVSLGQALSRLNAVLSLPDLYTVDYLQDATIQRFEFCIELYWKVLKKFLAHEKVETTTPRDTIQKAYQFRLIDDEKVWLSMLDDRNLTSHLYQQEEAKKIFQRIITYWPVMNITYQRLEKKFSTDTND